MPIYEYRCNHCQHQFEEMQKVNDPPLTHCEACGQDSLVKLVSAAGFQLKGTGWYVTDFKNSGQKPTPTEKPAETPDPNPKTETPPEKKPDKTPPESGEKK